MESILYAVWSFGLVFVACEISQRSCDALNEMDDDIGQLDWYMYPAEIQRMLPIIMENSQQPVIIKCFGSFPCSRETFKEVRVLFIIYIRKSELNSKCFTSLVGH